MRVNKNIHQKQSHLMKNLEMFYISSEQKLAFVISFVRSSKISGYPEQIRRLLLPWLALSFDRDLRRKEGVT